MCTYHDTQGLQHTARCVAFTAATCLLKMLGTIEFGVMRVLVYLIYIYIYDYICIMHHCAMHSLAFLYRYSILFPMF